MSSTAMISPCTSLHGIAALLLLLLAPYAGAQDTGFTNPNAPPYDYPHFSPSLALTMAGIVVALFFLVFLFALYVRYCDNGAISGSVRAITGGMSRRAAARGLDPSVIETFPTFLYSAVKELKIGKGALECAVCLCEFDDDETLRLIPNCDHVFHPDCIDAWLSSHTTCPVCRAELVPAISAEKNANLDIDAEARDPHAPRSPGNDNADVEVQVQMQPVQPVVMNLNEKLNRNRTRGTRSGRPRRFPRSHSTGHSILVQPGDDTDRFTLRLPTEVRRQIVKNRELHRSNSMVVLPREGSSRSGYRTGWEGGGGQKSYRRMDSLGPVVKSDRWVFSLTPTFLMRALSIKTPKVNEETSGTAMEAPFFFGARSDKSPEMDCEEGGSSCNWTPDRRIKLSNLARPLV